MRTAAAALVGGLGLLLAGCHTVRETPPARTALDQLLISNAADRAAASLKFQAPPGARIYFDQSFLVSTDADAHYAAAAVVDSLLKQGASLVSDQSKADVVVALRIGALSIDHVTDIIGIPSFDIPVPLAGTLSTPTLALWETAEQRGVAKLAITAWSVRQGTLVASPEPGIGYAHRTRKTLLIVIGWTSEDLSPEEAR